MSFAFHPTLSAAIRSGCDSLGLSDTLALAFFDRFRPFLMPLTGQPLPVQTVTVETSRNSRFVSFAHLTVTRTDHARDPYEVVSYTSKCTVKELDAYERGIATKAR